MRVIKKSQDEGGRNKGMKWQAGARRHAKRNSALERLKANERKRKRETEDVLSGKEQRRKTRTRTRTMEEQRKRMMRRRSGGKGVARRI